MGYAYIGNADLIPNKNNFVSYGGKYGTNSIDCPVVLYQEIGGLDESIKVALAPNYSLVMGQAIRFYQLGNMVDVIDTIPDAYIPTTVPVAQSATIGQTVVVKAVDENGKPMEWEAVDPMVLTSSTEGSIKRFRIIVDDNGGLSAVEVTE